MNYFNKEKDMSSGDYGPKRTQAPTPVESKAPERNKE